MTRRHIIIARIGFLLYLAALGWLCLGNFSSLPQIGKSFFGIETDKLAHFLMFLPFPFLMFTSFDVLPCRRWKYVLFILLSFALGCATGAATEFIQSLTPMRMPDIKDFYADVTGCLTSSLGTFLIYMKHAK